MVDKRSPPSGKWSLFNNHQYFWTCKWASATQWFSVSDETTFFFWKKLWNYRKGWNFWMGNKIWRDLEISSSLDHLEAKKKEPLCWKRPLIGLHPQLRLGNIPVAVLKTLEVTTRMSLTLWDKRTIIDTRKEEWGWIRKGSTGRSAWKGTRTMNKRQNESSAFPPLMV